MAMPSPPPDQSDSATATVPKVVRTARTLAWVHVGLGIIGLLLFIAGAAAVSGDDDRADALAAAAPPTGPLAAIGGLLSLLGLAALIVLAVNANKLVRLRPGARTWTMVAEIVLAVAAIVGIISVIVGPNDRDVLTLEAVVTAAGQGDVEAALLDADEDKAYGELEDGTKFEAPMDAAGEQALRAALDATSTPYDDDVPATNPLGIAYAIVSLGLAASVLWLLTRPHVAAAFASRPVDGPGSQFNIPDMPR